jgi:hypothetical protein
MRFLTYIFAIAVITATMGLTSAGADEPTETQHAASSHNDRFYVRNINGWRAVDNHHLVVWAPSKKHTYLLKTFGYCPGLRFAETIGIDSRLPYISNGAPAHIIVLNSSFNYRCAVDRLERVESFKAAKALVTERKKAALAEQGS